MRFETLTIHAGPKPDPAFGAVMTPIYQVSTFAFKGVKERVLSTIPGRETPPARSWKTPWPRWKAVPMDSPLARVWPPRRHSSICCLRATI